MKNYSYICKFFVANGIWFITENNQMFQIYYKNAVIMPGVVKDAECGSIKRFPGHYIGCCDLQSKYSITDLNFAIEQLSNVRFSLQGLIITFS